MKPLRKGKKQQNLLKDNSSPSLSPCRGDDSGERSTGSPRQGTVSFQPSSLSTGHPPPLPPRPPLPRQQQLRAGGCGRGMRCSGPRTRTSLKRSNMD